MRKLVIDSTGAVVPSTRFVAQPSPPRAQTSSPLQRLDRLLNKEEPPKILCIRGIGGIGDVLMTTPAVRAIKQKYPGVILDYATTPDYLNGALVKVLAANKDIDNIYDFRTIDKTQYSAVINFGDGVTACPATRFEIPGANCVNRIDIFAEHAGLVAPLQDTSINYEVLPNEQQWAMKWLSSRNLHQHKFILINANSSSRRRDMPQPELQRAVMQILRRFKGQVRGIVVLHDMNKSPDIDWRLDGVTPLVNYGVREIAALTNMASLVICPDSAILHLASALHKKTIALFGPTDPRARVNYHPEAIAVWPGQELFCKNCWYSPECRNGHMCWRRITADMIANPAIALLEGMTFRPTLKNIYTSFGPFIHGGKTIAPRKGQPFEVL